MSILVPRHRTIGVRLTEEEYATLERFCVQNGARSISDLARCAISNFVNRASLEGGLASAVSQNIAQVKELEQKLEKLSVELAIFKANSPRKEEGNGKKVEAAPGLEPSPLVSEETRDPEL